MAGGRFVNIEPSAQNLRALWDTIHELRGRLVTAEGKLSDQASTLSTHASQIASAQASVDQHQVLLNSKPWETTTTSTTPGSPPGSPGNPNPPPGGSPGGGTNPGPPDSGTFLSTDMIGAATIENSPLDILSWPITSVLTTLSWDATGMDPTFSARATWPNYTPPGWDGPLVFTIWLFLQIGGLWYGAGILQCWQRTGPCNGPPYEPRSGTNNIPLNWVYDSRWGPMAGVNPPAGSLIGFMMSAGDARGQTGVTSVRERTQIVTVPMPASNNGFTYHT